MFKKPLLFSMIAGASFACTKPELTLNDIGPAEVNFAASSASSSASIGSATSTEIAPSLTARLALRDGSTLFQIAEAARAVSDRSSVLQAEVRKQELAIEALKYDRLPQIVPRAQLPVDGRETSFGVGVRQVVLDGGRHAARKDQHGIQVELAKIKLWEERNAAAFEAVSRYVQVVRFANLTAETDRALRQHNDLRARVEIRVSGGVGDHGELDLIDIAIGDLRSDRLLHASAQAAAAAELALLTDMAPPSLSSTRLSTLADMISDVDNEHLAPALHLADRDIDLAAATTTEVRRSRLPGVVLEGFVDRRGGETRPGIGLSLSTDAFFGLSHGSKVSAAEAQEAAARSAYDRQARQTEIDIRRLDILFADLQRNAEEYRRQQIRANESTVLFLDQFAAGTRPLTDALRVYERANSVRRFRIDAEADAILNRLERARLLGSLAPLGQGLD